MYTYYIAYRNVRTQNKRKEEKNHIVGVFDVKATKERSYLFYSLRVIRNYLIYDQSKVV